MNAGPTGAAGSPARCSPACTSLGRRLAGAFARPAVGRRGPLHRRARPYGYHGLGDLGVFVFFGFGAVAGTTSCRRTVSSLSLWASVPVARSRPRLVVNNLRDIGPIDGANKLTLAVRLGDAATATTTAARDGAYGLVPVGLVHRQVAPGRGHCCRGRRCRSLCIHPGAPDAQRERGLSLNGCSIQTARLEVVFGVLFAVGIAL